MGLHTGEPVSGAGDYVGLDVHRAARICAAGHGGQILVSKAVEVLAAPDLPPGVTLRDLGTHRLKDLKEPERLLQVVHPELPADFPPLNALGAHPNNLPRQLTSFVGREREIEEVKRLLPTTGLLTITGTGGSGKTRLALRVAADLVDQYPDGVWLARLASLSEPTLVPQTIASAMGIPERPGRPLIETVADYLQPKTVLLVLDNCEHLLQACGDLVDTLLRLAPNVRVLATSREVLGIEGERIYRIPSLSVPDVSRLPPPDALSQFDAVQLFVERAAFSKPGFEITSDNAAEVAQVVHRLDGLPLAIELAAARVKALPVEVIAERLDDRFRLLTGGSRTGLLRHQTLRATLDWSYDLLSEEERIVLRRLSVFAGGFMLEAAEEICSGDGVAERDILDLLAHLVDKSLVMLGEREGHGRYRLLDTVRQYGLDRLLAAGEAAEARTRHRAWYLDLAERAEAEMYGPQDTKWLNRLEVEYNNLRAALEWSSAEKADAEITLRLAAALGLFWDYHTQRSEGHKWMETALARSGDIKSTARVRALYGAGRLTWRQADYGRAMVLFEESLALAQELDDQTWIARAFSGLGLVTGWQGDWDAAMPLFEKSLALSRQLDDKWCSAVTLVHMAGSQTRAWTARHRGDYASAVAWSGESLALFRTLGTKRGTALALMVTGHAIRLRGNIERAAALYRESLASFAETGDKWIDTECVTGLALIESARGDADRAARLLGAAETARETFGIALPLTDAGDQEQFWTAIRERPAETAFAAAWAEGRAMTLEQAIEYALAGETG
jgi:predicted ATPase